jgi:arylsulfatase A-like enzyme
MMTSRWTREHSIAWINGASRLVGPQTLAVTFGAAGYSTAAFVGNATLTRRVGLDAGFDVYDDELPNAEMNRPASFERVADGTTGRALDWLARRNDDPIFLWVHFQDPHGPYNPPPPYDEMFSTVAEPDAPLPALQANRGDHGIPAYQVVGSLRRPSEYANRYAGEIRYADLWLGHLLEAFEARSRPSVILLTADHGESFGEEGWYYSHGFRTTPDQTHIPFLLHAPGLRAQRRPELVHHVDVAPTLLELAGLPSPYGARGLALGALIRANKPIPPRQMFSDVGFSLTVYDADSFTRVESNGGIIQPGNFTLRRHDWPTGSTWGEGVPDESLRKLVNQYVGIEARVARAAPMEPEMAERLRALGYLGP